MAGSCQDHGTGDAAGSRFGKRTAIRRLSPPRIFTTPGSPNGLDRIGVKIPWRWLWRAGCQHRLRDRFGKNDAHYGRGGQLGGRLFAKVQRQRMATTGLDVNQYLRLPF